MFSGTQNATCIKHTCVIHSTNKRHHMEQCNGSNRHFNMDINAKIISLNHLEEPVIVYLLETYTTVIFSVFSSLDQDLLHVQPDMFPCDTG